MLAHDGAQSLGGRRYDHGLVEPTSEVKQAIVRDPVYHFPKIVARRLIEHRHAVPNQEISAGGPWQVAKRVDKERPYEHSVYKEKCKVDEKKSFTETSETAGRL